jgi:hypothetical protein
VGDEADDAVGAQSDGALHRGLLLRRRLGVQHDDGAVVLALVEDGRGHQGAHSGAPAPVTVDDDPHVGPALPFPVCPVPSSSQVTGSASTP